MGTDGGLRPLFRQHLDRASGWVWTAVETGGVTSGVADSYWSHLEHRVCGWTEFKKTDGWAVKFRPHQLPWLSLQVRCGVRTHVAVRARGRGSSGGTGDSLWLVRGAWATALADGGLSALPPEAYLRWYGGARYWSWDRVSRELLSAPLEEKRP